MLGEWAVVARATIRTSAVSNTGGERLGWRSIELYRNATSTQGVGLILCPSPSSLKGGDVSMDCEGPAFRFL